MKQISNPWKTGLNILALMGIGITGLFLARGLGFVGAENPPSQPPTRPVLKNLGALSLSFEENRGQADPQVRFLARARGLVLYLGEQTAVFQLARPDEPEPIALTMKLPGAPHRHAA